MSSYELAAAESGYGPRIPCTFIASPSEQKVKCRMFFLYFRCYLSSTNDIFHLAHLHRRRDGKLGYGELLQWSGDKLCNVVFNIFVPDDLHACPHVLVICCNVHNHAAPAPLTTPPALLAIFNQLLLDMSWLLTDATP